MRKWILLALALGAAELFKREAIKRGLSRSQLLATIADNTFGRSHGDETPPA